MGGTGTYPFLIAIAWWDAGGLEVEQFFMREQSEEHSVLAALAARMAERRVLVTFNGKTFDWPLLETRFHMTRKIPAPAPRTHLDFLHPAQISGGCGRSARLQDLEKHVLGWNRGTDVMSEVIPQIYFDYLRGGSPDRARPDLPSQSDGSARARGACDANPRCAGRSGTWHGRDALLRLFGASAHVCERRGEAIRARRRFTNWSIASELPPETDRAARKFLARLAKRHGDHALACGLWEKILGVSREGFEAYEQLAIHYERRAREPQRARQILTSRKGARRAAPHYRPAQA